MATSFELVDGLEGLHSFITLHRAQLQSSGVPEIFWETLYKKLKHSVSVKFFHNSLITIDIFRSFRFSMQEKALA